MSCGCLQPQPKVTDIEGSVRLCFLRAVTFWVSTAISFLRIEEGRRGLFEVGGTTRATSFHWPVSTTVIHTRRFLRERVNFTFLNNGLVMIDQDHGNLCSCVLQNLMAAAHLTERCMHIPEPHRITEIRLSASQTLFLPSPMTVCIVTMTS